MYHEKTKRCAPLPTTEVKTGLVQENAQEGAKINLFDFPAPLLHEKTVDVTSALAISSSPKIPTLTGSRSAPGM